MSREQQVFRIGFGIAIIFSGICIILTLVLLVNAISSHGPWTPPILGLIIVAGELLLIISFAMRRRNR